MFNGSYYNPFLYQPYSQGASQLATAGIGKNIGKGLGMKGLLGRFNWDSFLTSTGKTLNVINQAIPVFYQVKPIISNAKTMFRVLGAVKDSDKSNNRKINPTTSNNQTSSIQTQSAAIDSNNFQNDNSSNNTGNPTFFL